MMIFRLATPDTPIYAYGLKTYMSFYSQKNIIRLSRVIVYGDTTMDQVIQKLRLKDQQPILVLNAPEEFAQIMASMPSKPDVSVRGAYPFIILFTRDLKEATKYAKSVIEAIAEDGYIWICYPKGTSKKYESELNRMKVLEVFAPFDFEGVTQIAIDDDWSALRVKPVHAIKTMKRKWALSDKGKERIKDNK